FIAYKSLSISSGPKYLPGVRHFLCLLYPIFDAIRPNPTVQSTIRGARKTRADSVKRKFPLTTSHLQTIATASHTYDDLLFATILSYCFYGCHRIGELTQKNEHHLFDWRKVIKRSSL
ncbi:hypothetical protein FA13DRAFT_1605786, partial [Coprinellus micaceus]